MGEAEAHPQNMIGANNLAPKDISDYTATDCSGFVPISTLDSSGVALIPLGAESLIVFELTGRLITQVAKCLFAWLCDSLRDW